MDWRQVLDSATDTAIITLDLQGCVTSWSAGAERLLGWSEAEMGGQPLDRLFPEDTREGRIRKEMADAVARGRGGGDEGWRLHREGKRIWAAGELTPLRDVGGEVVGFVKVVRDRTAQREAEERLVEERRALTVLNRAGAALALETDLQRLVQIVTDAGVELTGAQFGAFFYNQLDEAGESYMLYTLSGAPPEAFATFPMPRNTAVFAPTFNGEGIVRSDDITQDPRYGRNAPRKGMPEGHLPVRSYLAVPVFSRGGEVLGGLFFGHADVGIFTERSERGMQGLAAEAAVAIDNADLAKAAARELDERRRAEAALLALNATLEQQVAERTAQLQEQEAVLRHTQKMEAVGQLTGGIAHDFNNLLQVITGNLEILQRHLADGPSKLLRAADHAMIGARKGAALTQRLLAFSRRQPLAPKPTDLNRLVQDLSEMIRRTFGETVLIETSLAAGVWWVDVDPTELESALLNLAVNGRDAMPGGGRLTIRTENRFVPEDPSQGLAAGDYVAVSISDTGEGMDDQTISQAFDPFFTTKAVGKGTGLGLSQVYGFVKQSGGHVQIESELGSGTTVRILLPRLTDAGSLAEEATSQPSSVQLARGETVLVVEDDDDVRTYSVEILRELGYRVLEAHDGPAALSLLERQAQVDVLFTDVVLPNGLNGAEVAEQARALQPALRVLFTTGYPRDAFEAGKGPERGGALLMKPFSAAELAQCLRSVLNAES